jgi:hypothetical protein
MTARRARSWHEVNASCGTVRSDSRVLIPSAHVSGRACHGNLSWRERLLSRPWNSGDSRRWPRPQHLLSEDAECAAGSEVVLDIEGVISGARPDPPNRSGLRSRPIAVGHFVEPRGHGGGSIAVERAIEVFRDISDVRRGQHVVETPKGVIIREGLDAENVDRGSRNRTRFQCPDE